MCEPSPHPDALRNWEWARIPESKIRGYAFKRPDKSRPLRALGFSEEAGNWRDLHDAILDALPFHAATFAKQDEHGTTYEVVVHISGPSGKVAPVKTYWIYDHGVEIPRLTSLYIVVRDWKLLDQEKESDPDNLGDKPIP